MKLLYVTSQSGRRINGFMRSAIIAARQLNIDFTILVAGNGGSAADSLI